MSTGSRLHVCSDARVVKVDVDELEFSSAGFFILYKNGRVMLATVSLRAQMPIVS